MATHPNADQKPVANSVAEPVHSSTVVSQVRPRAPSTTTPTTAASAAVASTTASTVLANRSRSSNAVTNSATATTSASTAPVTAIGPGPRVGDDPPKADAQRTRAYSVNAVSKAMPCHAKLE